MGLLSRHNSLPLLPRLRLLLSATVSVRSDALVAGGPPLLVARSLAQLSALPPPTLKFSQACKSAGDSSWPAPWTVSRQSIATGQSGGGGLRCAPPRGGRGRGRARSDASSSLSSLSLCSIARNAQQVGRDATFTDHPPKIGSSNPKLSTPSFETRCRGSRTSASRES